MVVRRQERVGSITPNPTWRFIWVVASGVISRVTIHIRGLMTPLITIPKP